MNPRPTLRHTVLCAAVAASLSGIAFGQATTGRIAGQAECRHLILHHLVPADDPDIGEGHWTAATRRSWHGPLTIGRDGLVVDLSADRPDWKGIR